MIVDDIVTIHEKLVLHIKYREENNISHKLVFTGVIQLTSCTVQDVEWCAFDTEALRSDIKFEYDAAHIATLANKYQTILQHPHSVVVINS